MRKKAPKKSAAANLLVWPMPATPSPNRSPNESPTDFEFEINAFNTVSSSSKKMKTGMASAASLLMMQPTARSPPAQKAPSAISDLKNLASSLLDIIKHQLDRSHSEIIKDIEASHSRLHKRLNIQTHACQQVIDEAEKDYKKMSQRISGSYEVMMASHAEFMAEAQASASRVCKTLIPELIQSFENSIDALGSRYGVSSTSV